MSLFYIIRNCHCNIVETLYILFHNILYRIVHLMLIIRTLHKLCSNIWISFFSMLSTLCAAKSNNGNHPQKRTFLLVLHKLGLCIIEHFSVEKLQRLLADLEERGPYPLPQEGRCCSFAMCVNSTERDNVVF